jgi:AcrR family transcriptional regulator
MPSRAANKRAPLTRDRVLRAAVDLADREGLGALTMRRLGSELGVEAMSLYKHVANKEAILEGIVEIVIGEIALPDEGANWKEAMRRRAMSAREVYSRHSWAIGLLEGRSTMGPVALDYVNAVLGSLRSAGFSIEDAGHAFWLLDSFVYGHIIHETSLGFDTTAASTEATRSIAEQATTKEYPHLLEIAEHALRNEYSVDIEFEFGLDLILDGLDRARE